MDLTRELQSSGELDVAGQPALAAWCLGWSVAWLVPFAVFYLGLQPAGYGWFGASWVGGGWYALATLAGVFIYRGELRGTGEGPPGAAPLLALAATLSLVVGAYAWGSAAWPLSAEGWSRAEAIRLGMLRLDHVYLVGKLPELAFQQALILVLTRRLQRYGLSGWRLLAGFAFVFGLIHAPLIVVKGLVGLPFVLAAASASVVFPLLITRFRWGVAYSYCAHLLGYLVAGLAVRASMAG